MDGDNKNKFQKRKGGKENRGKPFEKKIKGRFNRDFAKKSNEGFDKVRNKQNSDFKNKSSNNKQSRPGKVRRMMNRNKKNSNGNKKRKF